MLQSQSTEEDPVIVAATGDDGSGGATEEGSRQHHIVSRSRERVARKRKIIRQVGNDDSNSRRYTCTHIILIRGIKIAC